MRSTIAPSVRARASASIASVESDGAFRRGELVAELAQDLDALDRVDAQVGLDVQVEAQGLDRVAGPVADDLQQPRGDRRTIGRRSLDRPSAGRSIGGASHGGRCPRRGARAIRRGRDGCRRVAVPIEMRRCAMRSRFSRSADRIRERDSARPSSRSVGKAPAAARAASARASALGGGAPPRHLGRSGTRASSPSGPRGTSASSSGTTRGPGRPAGCGAKAGAGDRGRGRRTAVGAVGVLVASWRDFQLFRCRWTGTGTAGR